MKLVYEYNSNIEKCIYRNLDKMSEAGQSDVNYHILRVLPTTSEKNSPMSSAQIIKLRHLNGRLA